MITQFKFHRFFHMAFLKRIDLLPLSRHLRASWATKFIIMISVLSALILSTYFFYINVSEKKFEKTVLRRKNLGHYNGAVTNSSVTNSSYSLAYMVYATDDITACNAILAFHRIHELDVDPHLDFVVLAVASEMSDKSLHRLHSVPGLLISHVDAWENRFSSKGSTWHLSLTKLKIFQETVPITKMKNDSKGTEVVTLKRYDKVIYLDTDSVIMRNLDHLFNLPDADIWAPRAYWLPQPFFQSTLMVIRPNDANYKKLEKTVKETTTNLYDMDVLNKLFINQMGILPNHYVVLNSDFGDINGKLNGFSISVSELADLAMVIHYSCKPDGTYGKPWAIGSTKPTGLARILLATQSIDKAERDLAEKAFNEEWRLNPKSLFPSLASLIHDGGSNEVKITAAIFFRRSIFTKSSLGWKNLSEEEKLFCKEKVLSALGSEQIPQARRKISDAVAELASYIHKTREEWPELLSFISSSITSQSSVHREIAFRLVSYAPLLISSVPAEISKNMFSSGFQDPDATVRLEALRSFLTFYTQCSSSTRKVLNEIIPLIAPTIQSLKSDDASLSEALKSLNDFIPKTKNPLKALYPNLMPLLEDLARDPNSEQDIKYSSLEAIVGIAEQQPQIIKTNDPGFSERILPIIFMLFTCMEDEESWYSSSHDDDDDPDLEHVFALQTLDRLSGALGGEVLLPVSFSIISSYLDSTDWRLRYGALMSIAYLSEGSADLMETKIEEVMKCIFVKAKDSHPRVRWAVAHSIGQLCEDISAEALEPHRNNIIEAILLLMSDTCPRVHNHANRALVDCCSFCEKSSLIPYLDSLVQRLFYLLQNGRSFVQEQVITTLEYLSSAVGDDFVKYYDTMVPLMMEIMKNAVQEEYRMMRVKAMECIGCVGVSVGKEVFLRFASEFLSYVISIQQTISGPEDPIVLYLNTTWLNICLTIKKDFTQYLSLVMPNLLVTASKVPEIVVADEDEDTDAKYGEGWEAITYDHKKIVIHSSVMEDKNSALSLILSFAEELEEDFYPYLESVFGITFESLQNRYSDSVRNTCARLIPVLLNCLLKSKTDPANIKLVIDKSIEEFIKSIQSFEKDLEFVYTALDCLNDCFSHLDGNSVSDISGVLKMTSLLCVRYYQTALQKVGMEDDIVDNFIDEMISEGDIIEYIPRIVHTLFEKYGVALYPTVTLSFEECMKLFLSEGANNIDYSSSRNFLLHMWCSVVEFCPSESLSWLQTFSNLISVSLKDQDPEIRRITAYGVGLCAATKIESYYEFVCPLLPLLFEACEESDARDSSKVYATENCISAVGKILCSFSSKLNDEDSLAMHLKWLSCLPITFDDDEYEATYLYLIAWSSKYFTSLPMDANFKLASVLLIACALKSIPDSVIEVARPMCRELFAFLGQEMVSELRKSLSEAKIRRLISRGIISP